MPSEAFTPAGAGTPRQPASPVPSALSPAAVTARIAYRYCVPTTAVVSLVLVTFAASVAPTWAGSPVPWDRKTLYPVAPGTDAHERATCAVDVPSDAVIPPGAATLRQPVLPALAVLSPAGVTARRE